MGRNKCGKCGAEMRCVEVGMVGDVPGMLCRGCNDEGRYVVIDYKKYRIKWDTRLKLASAIINDGDIPYVFESMLSMAADTPEDIKKGIDEYEEATHKAK